MDKSIEWVRVPNQAPIDGPLPEDEPIVASLAQDDPQTVEDSSEEEVEEEEDKASNSPRGSHASLYESLSIVPTSPRSVSVMSSYVALSLPGSALADVTVEAAHGAQLASAVFISDIEQVLERVWRPALEENGVGVISNLCLSDVLHRCDVIVTSMRAVMCCEESTKRSKNAAADLLAWIVLQRGSARLLRSKDVASDVIRLVQDLANPVSDAGRRTIRNLVARSLEYCKVVVKSHAFKVLGCQVQKSYTIEILSSITGRLKATEDATSANLLTRVFNLCVAPILSSFSEGLPPSCMAHAFQSLTSLMRPRLAERILSDSQHLLDICSRISPDQHPFVQEAALVLIDSLLHLSYRVDEIHDYLMKADGVINLFSLLRCGNSDQELLVLHTLKCMQSSQRDRFEESIGIEELTRIQVILDNGEMEHKKLALSLMSGVLEASNLLWTGINDLEISKTITLLLKDGDLDMQLCALELLNSLTLHAPEYVIPEIVSEEGSSILESTLKSLAFSKQPQLYLLLTSILIHGGERAGLIGDELFPLVSKNICDGDLAIKFNAVIPCLKALKLERMDDASLSIAIKDGIVRFVLEYCASVMHNTEFKEGEYSGVMENLVVVLKILDRAVKQDSGRKAVFVCSPNVLDHDGILINMLQFRNQGVAALGLDCILQLAACKESDTEPVHAMVLDIFVTTLETASIQVRVKILKVFLQFLPRICSTVLADSGILPAVSGIFQNHSNNEEVACLVLDIMGSIGLIDAELTARSILRNQSIEDCAWNQYISLQENLSPATRKSVLHVFNEVRKQKNTPVKEGMERCPVEDQGEPIRLIPVGDIWKVDPPEAITEERIRTKRTMKIKPVAVRPKFKMLDIAVHLNKESGT